MTRIVEKTNPRLTNLILLLKNNSRENEAKNLARDRKQAENSAEQELHEVNLSKINGYAQNGETIIIAPEKCWAAVCWSSL